MRRTKRDCKSETNKKKRARRVVHAIQENSWKTFSWWKYRGAHAMYMAQQWLALLITAHSSASAYNRVWHNLICSCHSKSRLSLCIRMTETTVSSYIFHWNIIFCCWPMWTTSYFVCWHSGLGRRTRFACILNKLQPFFADSLFFGRARYIECRLIKKSTVAFTLFGWQKQIFQGICNNIKQYHKYKDLKFKEKQGRKKNPV